jgi:peptidoglycan/LPS O-acetylase OafA/YrhL
VREAYFLEDKTPVSACSQRLPELDILRAVAICLVVFAHFPTLPSLYVDPAIKFWCATFGLSLFLFLSGFLLYRSNTIVTLSDVPRFYKKRVLRIYPLYVIVVAVYVLLQYSQLNEYFVGLTLSLTEIIANVVGLQALLNIPSYGALWFVGLILIYYLIYPLMMLATAGKTFRILLFSCATIALLAVLRITFDLVNLRLLYYFVIFIGGVLTSKALVYFDLTRLHTKEGLTVFMLAAIPLLGMSMSLYQHNFGETGELVDFYANLLNYIPKTLVSFLFITCALCAAKLVTLSFSSRAYSSLLVISFLSYAIYLIHPLILTACLHADLILPRLIGVQIDSVLACDWHILISIPIILAVSYALQRVQNRITAAVQVQTS